MGNAASCKKENGKACKWLIGPELIRFTEHEANVSIRTPLTPLTPLPSDGKLVHRRVLQHYILRYLFNTWWKKGALRVKYLGQEHNALSRSND